MADFYQNGIITTLHNLTSRHLADLESDLMQFKKQRSIGLLLPPLYSELEGEALPNVEIFAKNIIDTGQLFLENQMETPFTPSWSRVKSALPDIYERIYKAVEADYQEFSD